MLTAPFPGSGPARARWLRTSEEIVAPVSDTRRAHSARIAPGESRSDPVSISSPTTRTQPPANTLNVRRDARQVNTEPVIHSASRPVRLWVRTIATMTSVVQISQKSRSSRRSAPASSTSTSGTPRTR